MRDAAFHKTGLCLLLLSMTGCSYTDRNNEFNLTSSKQPYDNTVGMISPSEAIMAVVCAEYYAGQQVDSGAPPPKSGDASGIPKSTAADGMNSADQKNSAQKAPGNIINLCNKLWMSTEGAGDSTAKFNISQYVATTAFYTLFRGPTMADSQDKRGQIARNRVQDQILRAADFQCGNFKVELARAGSTKETGFGLLGVLTGGIGAITTGGWSRGMAAAAGASSGASGVIDQAVFKNESLKVILGGIDQKRLEIWDSITPNRNRPLAEYDLELAIKDGVRYVDACNVVEGLSKISDIVAHGGGSAAPAATSTEAKVVQMIDGLSAQQMQFLVNNDKPKLMTLPSDPPTASDAVLQNYKDAYKADALSGKAGRLGRLDGLLIWAQSKAK